MAMGDSGRPPHPSSHLVNDGFSSFLEALHKGEHPTTRNRPVVIVHWVDSSIMAGQHEPHESPIPTVIESAGFLVASTEDYVTMTRDIHDDHDHRGALSIPRVAIQTMRQIT